MTELEQFKKWVEQTKRYFKLIREVDELKELLKEVDDGKKETANDLSTQ